jgi:peroxiredoxin
MGQRQFVSQVKNKPAPDFELTALDGAKVRLSDQRGKPVLLAFFAYS